MSELAIRAFPDQNAWSRWLERNHGSATGVWLRIPKTGAPTVSYPEAVEAALCYGWIDGQRTTEGEASYLQKFTPRTKKSIWSKINREKALALIEAGRMQPAGLREVERAKTDGRWDRAYDSPRQAGVPGDLQAALDRNRRAAANFQTLDSRNRYAVLFRIHHAKKPETRERRIREFVEMLARGEKIHP
jgi:uncharacterized protein YdeI (YjbR/CyaY-like superfamily)